MILIHQELEKAREKKMLNGWKEIAIYMDKGVRTVQRRERVGLPVHRMWGLPRSPVTASPGEKTW